MRLVCPNCGAQYEVDDRVMPEAGRDVQCSNCGHAWFHTPPHNAKASADKAAEPKIEMPVTAPPPPPVEQPVVDVTSALSASAPSEPEPRIEEDLAAAETPAPAEEPAPIEAPASEPEPASVSEPEATPEPTPTEPAEDTPAPTIPAAAATAATAREAVSDEVKQILQEEAKQELRAREAEQQGAETQPEPKVDATPAPEEDDLAARIQDLSDEVNAAQDEAAQSAATQDDAKPQITAPKAPVVEPATRERDLRSRDMLPDIEEINSTLDAPDTPDETKIDLGPAEEAVASGGGFGRGFRLTLLLAVILVGVYILAPQIADRFPQAQGFMDSYVAIGDKVRVTLEGAMQSAIEGMRGLMETASEG